MKPILFRESERNFDTNGIGVLTDATSCVVTEELNGSFELKLEYPVNGIFANEIDFMKIILAKPNEQSNPQPFRIYRIDRNLNKISVNAQHISYDLAGYITTFQSFRVETSQFWEKVFENCTCDDNPFSIEIIGDLSDYGFVSDAPRSVRNVLMREGVAYGDLEFDKFNINILRNKRGKDTGIKIKYGLNLTQYDGTLLADNFYTHVLPFFRTSIDDDETLFNEKFYNVVFLPERIIPTGITSSVQIVKAIDLSSSFASAYDPEKFEELPENVKESVYEDMRFEAEMQYSLFTRPKFTHSVKFAQSTDPQLKKFEKIMVGDTVWLQIPQFNVDIPLRCNQSTYDALQSRYTDLVFGEVKRGITRTVNDMKKKISENKTDIVEERVYTNRTFEKKT